MIKNFKSMECPICHKYYFINDNEEDENEVNYNSEQDDYCPYCGWKYDLYQSENQNVANMTNELSLNEFKKNYEFKIKLNPKYNYLDDNKTSCPHPCPVCGKYEFKDVGSFEICPICGWQDDDLMEQEPTKWGGNANDLCLNEYRARYKNSIIKNK